MTPAERRAAYGRLRMRGLSIGEAATELGRCRRTAERYEQWLCRERGIEGPRRRPDGWIRPLILDHLTAHPSIAVSAWDLARVVGGSTSLSATANRALRLLVADGLIDVLIEPMNLCDRRPVRRYRLVAAREEARAA